MLLGMKGGATALTPEQTEKLNLIIKKRNYGNYDEAINNINDYNVDDLIFIKNSQGNYDDNNYKQGGYYKKTDASTIVPLHENDLKNLTKRDVIDNLTSSDTDLPLAANQGKEIDSVLTKIYNALGLTKASDKFSGFSGNVLSNNKNLVEILQTMADKLDREVDYVDTYDDLDSLNKDDYVGKIVNVRNSQGSKLLGTYKPAGFYRTDGSSWIFAGTNIDDKENKFKLFSTLDDADGQEILGETAIIIGAGTEKGTIWYNHTTSKATFSKDGDNTSFTKIGGDDAEYHYFVAVEEYIDNQPTGIQEGSYIFDIDDNKLYISNGDDTFEEFDKTKIQDGCILRIKSNGKKYYFNKADLTFIEINNQSAYNTFSVYHTDEVTYAAGTSKVKFNTIEGNFNNFDLNNNVFIVPTKGIWNFSGNFVFKNYLDGKEMNIGLRKNGELVIKGTVLQNGSNNVVGAVLTGSIKCEVGDEIYLEVYNGTGSDRATRSGAAHVRFSGYLNTNINTVISQDLTSKKVFIDTYKSTKEVGNGDAVLVNKFNTFTVTAGKKVEVILNVPTRNNDSGRGGGYIQSNLIINGTKYNIGNTGYDAAVMVTGGSEIATYVKNYIINPANFGVADGADYDISLEIRARSYSGTLIINGSHDINKTSNNLGNAGDLKTEVSDQNFTTLFIKEI